MFTDSTEKASTFQVSSPTISHAALSRLFLLLLPTSWGWNGSCLEARLHKSSCNPYSHHKFTDIPVPIPDHANSSSAGKRLHWLFQLLLYWCTLVLLSQTECCPKVSHCLSARNYQCPMTELRRNSHSCNQAPFGDLTFKSLNSLSWKWLKVRSVLGSKYQICPHFNFAPGGYCIWDTGIGPDGPKCILVFLRKPELDMWIKGMFPSGLVFGPTFSNLLGSSKAHPGKGCWWQRLIKK